MTTRTKHIGRALGLLAAWLIALPVVALPYTYYVLRTVPSTDAASVMSLESNNTISVSGTQLSLGKYGFATLPAGKLTPGTALTGTGFFTLDATLPGSRVVVPQELQGEAFVVPHREGSHKYLLLSPHAATSVSIDIGGNTTTLALVPGVVSEFDAGADNSTAGIITSDEPIVVAHIASVSGVERHVYPVAPSTQAVFGVRSQQVVVAAQEDGTTLSVYSSDGTSTSHNLNAGEQLEIGLGSSGVQGGGDALHLSANQPIAAVQYDDGDGLSATALWPESLFARNHGFAANTQYAVAVCTASNVVVTLYRGGAAPETQLCSGSSTTPGKVYFGSTVTGPNLQAGWYLISSEPVYAVAEQAATEREGNIKGFNPPVMVSPVLNTPVATTSTNPLTLTGTAAANQTVRIYVNGIGQETTIANSSGDFSIPAALFDGSNTVYAVAVVGNDESAPSNSAQVTYSNTVSRSQSGTITGTVVWTPGVPAQPYTVTAADLTIASGAKLILQPGTVVQFGSARKIVVNGQLVAQGTASSKIRFTTTSTAPAKGAWAGITINNGADATITDAIVEYAANGVAFTGPTTGTPQPLGGLIENSELRNNTTAVYLTGFVNPAIRNNVIQLNSNGIYLNANSTTLAASPSITANRVVSNSSYGVVVRSYVSGPKLPAWTLEYNNISGNTTHNLFLTRYSSTYPYSSPSAGKILARKNWWGSTSVTTVAAKIYDHTDDALVPFVDFGNYLNAEAGIPVPGEMLVGTLASNTTVAAGASTQTLGHVLVPLGVTLTIPSNANLNAIGNIIVASGGNLTMAGDSTLSFNGLFGVIGQSGSALLLQGDAEHKVVLTSGKTTKAKGNWAGISINAGTTATIAHALMEYADSGVKFIGATTGTPELLGGFLENSELRNNTNGVYLSGYVNPAIRGNLIHLNTDGLYLDANSTTLSASPSITANDIINNSSDGVVLRSYVSNPKLPTWTLSNNSIYGNASYNFLLTRNGSAAFASPATSKVIARNNWWGTNAPSTIITDIYDYSDSTALPSLDYGNYLNSLGGDPVPGAMPMGTLSESTAFSTTETTRILGDLVVPNGVTLTIPSDAVVRVYGDINVASGGALSIAGNASLSFVGDFGIQVQSGGTFSLQGSSESRAVLTSGFATKAKGNWVGVLVNTGATATISHALIEYADSGVAYVGPTTGSPQPLGSFLENSELRNNTNGVYLSGYVNPTIRNNLFQQNTTGIHLDANSTTLSASPAITQNTVTNNSSYGVVVRSYVSGPKLPTWTLENNSIYGNTTHNLYIARYSTSYPYSSPSTTKIYARNNWWGSADPTTIASKIFDYSDDALYPTLDYGNYLSADGGTPVAGEMLIGALLENKTFEDGESALVIGAINIPSGVTLTLSEGASLSIGGRYPITVLSGGALIAEGTEANNIVFTSARPQKSPDDWVGIVANVGSTLSLKHVLIEYAWDGVAFFGGVTGTPALLGGVIEDSVIRYSKASGIYLHGYVNPTIRRNLIEKNSSGIHLDANSATLSASPSITNNQIISNNSHGVVVRSYVSGPKLPSWTLANNNISDNTTYNLRLTRYSSAYPYSNPSTTKVIAKNNWWGSADPTTIASKIFDYSDDALYPTLDYGNYLSAENGDPVAGDMISGALLENKTIASGSTALVIGAVDVPAGVTLTLSEGASLSFAGYYPVNLLAGSSLVAEGSEANKVTFTSSRPQKTAGDWSGIKVNTGATFSLRNTVVEYAYDGIAFFGGTTGSPAQLGGLVEDTIIRYSSASGIYIVGYANPTIRRNLIERNVNGIWMDSNSATLRATPEITDNEIINNNKYGLAVRQWIATGLLPAPVITGNSIYNSSYPSGYYNFYFDAYRAFLDPVNNKIVATGNWWGSPDPVAIAARIYDHTDITTVPLLNFGGYLESQDGNPVSAAYLGGRVSGQAGISLQEGEVYQVLSPIHVPTGESLTIPRGVTLRFLPGTSFTIAGAVEVEGEAGQEVVMTSIKTIPAASDWDGIVVNNGASLFDVQGLVIQYAHNGIYFNASGAMGSVASSLIQYCGNAGVYVHGNSRPLVSGSRIIANKYGFYVYGTKVDATDPKPTINQNDIYANTTSALTYANYTTTPSVQINGTNNWWGTTAPSFTGSALAYSPFSPVPLYAPGVKAHSVANAYFSPNGDLSQDEAIISATLSEIADWQLEVRSADGGGVVRGFSGNGATLTANWDGKDAVSADLPEGQYALTVRTVAAGRSGFALYRNFVIDKTSPTAILDAMLSVVPQRNVLAIPVNGTAVDENFSNYSVDYGLSSTPATWTSIVASVATSAENKQLANWTVGTTTGGAHIPNGNHTLRLTARDLAGNSSVAVSPIAIDNLTVTGVTHSGELNITSGQPAQINFIINLPGTFKIKIYDLETGITGDPVRTLTVEFDSAGAKSMGWDGKDESGQIVSGKAYLYVVEGSDGTRQGMYDITAVPAGSVTGTFSQINTTCDPYRNKFYVLQVTAPQPGLAGIQLTTPQGVIYPFGVQGKPVMAGTTTLRWDCRNPATGALITGAASQYSAFIPLPKNTILVTGNDYAPAIRGIAPVVEVQANPYLIYLSYAQTTKIVYNLGFINDSQAEVQVKLLPPLVLNFDDPSAILIYEGDRAPGVHELTWQGTLPGVEGSAMRSMGSAEGAYTFAIKATANGMSTLYRGTLSAYQ